MNHRKNINNQRIDGAPPCVNGFSRAQEEKNPMITHGRT